MNSLHSAYPFVTKLSSAGLVYYHFGKRVLSQILDMSDDHPSLPALYKKVYEHFLEEVDAGDNGISACEGIPK